MRVVLSKKAPMMKVALCLFALVVSQASAFNRFLQPRRYGSAGAMPPLPGLDPEIMMNATQIIAHWGYPVQTYDVTTQDGYIIQIQRIPYGKNGPGSGPRPVIFMQHGLECSSTNWITNLPSESAAFIFADAGFDVWLGNFRGNTYGLRHIRLSTKQKAFWAFSWDEMAKYDLDATISFALATSGAAQLYYMGHSEGTMTAFAKFSTDIPFSQKIKKFFALGPVTTVKHIQGALRIIAPYTKELEWFFYLVGVNRFLPNDWLMDLLAKTLCDWPDTNPLCDNILFLFCGPNSHQLNDSRVPVYIAHAPAGTSTQNIVHFGQQVNSGLFQMYNYGSPSANAAHYQGSTTPPLYDLTKMTTETYLFWGDLDWLADPTDVRNSIIPYVQNLAGNYEYSDFNHLDFIWGLKAASQVYNKIIQIIQSN